MLMRANKSGTVLPMTGVVDSIITLSYLTLLTLLCLARVGVADNPKLASKLSNRVFVSLWSLDYLIGSESAES